MLNVGGMIVGYDKSLILEGNGVTFVVDKQCNHLRDLKKSPLSGNSYENWQEKTKEVHNLNHSGGVSYKLLFKPAPVVPPYGSFLELKEGKDLLGCQFIQKQLEEGSPQDVHLKYHESVDHVVKIMSNPFGNRLIWKSTDVCSEDQKMQIQAPEQDALREITVFRI